MIELSEWGRWRCEERWASESDDGDERVCMTSSATTPVMV
jgi:hypothetical protein